MKYLASLTLNNYSVSIIASNNGAVELAKGEELGLLNVDNPRTVVDTIGSIGGIESVIVKDLHTNEILLTSELFVPEE